MCSTRRFLIEELRRDAADPNSSHDFGKDIIPYLVKQRQGGRASFRPLLRALARRRAHIYWRDVGTVDAYWAANIDLTDVVPDLDLYDRDWPIWTYGEITPPAKFVHDVDGRRGSAVSSLVSGGCIVSGAAISRSLLFTGVRVHSYSTIHEAVILPYVRVRPELSAEQGGHRRRRADPRRPGGRRGSRGSTPGASAAPKPASR